MKIIKIDIKEIYLRIELSPRDLTEKSLLDYIVYDIIKK